MFYSSLGQERAEELLQDPKDKLKKITTSRAEKEEDH